MQAPPDDPPPDDAQRASQRRFDLVFGLFFLALGVVIVVLPEAPPGPGRWIAALIVGALGLEAVVSALRGRRALAARLGPLP